MSIMMLVFLGVLGLAGVGLAGGLAMIWVSKLKRRLQESQAQDEWLSQRCDELSGRLDRLETADRIEHLSDLVRAGVRSDHLDGDVGRKLEAYLQDLRVD